MGGYGKKKVYQELKQYFPGQFNGDDSIQFYGKIKERILLIEQIVLEGESDALLAKMLAIDQFFADSSKPDVFDENSPEDAMVQADLLFQNLCSILESQGVINAKQLTTLEFYARLDYFRKQNTPKNL